MMAQIVGTGVAKLSSCSRAYRTPLDWEIYGDFLTCATEMEAVSNFNYFIDQIVSVHGYSMDSLDAKSSDKMFCLFTRCLSYSIRYHVGICGNTDVFHGNKFWAVCWRRCHIDLESVPIDARYCFVSYGVYVHKFNVYRTYGYVLRQTTSKLNSDK